MSEEKQDYITDALEMMGLEMIGIAEPKQIITEVSGFIPVFEVVLHHYKDYMTALVFGRMWQYCGMGDGVCKASLERIGKDIEVSAVTVMRHAEKLVNDGYLIDTTPDRRNAPHIYMDGRRVEMKSRITAGMTINNATVINSKATVINSQLIKQDNTNIKEKTFQNLQGIENSIYAGRLTTQADIDATNQAQSVGWRGRELLPPQYLEYGDWWHKRTGLHMYGAKAKQKIDSEWMNAFKAWYENDVTIASLEQAYKNNEWRTIGKPSQITTDAKAIQAAGAKETKQIETFKDGSGYV